jgi:hypothetical protein
MRDTDRLRRELEVALRETQDPGVVLPRLHRLARGAPEGSEAFAFAHRHLAEILVERDPWRAALHARKATAASPDDDRGWAGLALCHTLLGNFRAAATAYRRALDCAPSNPWYAHNLGHLLDVALGRAEEALSWLRVAYDGARRDGEIALSYAHALARAGDVDGAKKVLRRAARGGVNDEHLRLLGWLEGGARGERPPTERGRVELRDGADELPRSRRARASHGRQRAMSEVEVVLDRGLARLPLGPHQRARAHEIAKDLVARRAPADGAQARVLAAAVAYAAIYEASVPLTQSEVASTFRVSVSSLRGRFSTLRGRLSRARTRE